MTGPELKAEAVRALLPFYVVASEARIHPSKLSQVFNGRVPLDAETERSVRAAI